MAIYASLNERDFICSEYINIEGIVENEIDLYDFLFENTIFECDVIIWERYCDTITIRHCSINFDNKCIEWFHDYDEGGRHTFLYIERKRFVQYE